MYYPCVLTVKQMLSQTFFFFQRLFNTCFLADWFQRLALCQQCLHLQMMEVFVHRWQNRCEAAIPYIVQGGCDVNFLYTLMLWVSERSWWMLCNNPLIFQGCLFTVGLKSCSESFFNSFFAFRLLLPVCLPSSSAKMNRCLTQTFSTKRVIFSVPESQRAAYKGSILRHHRHASDVKAFLGRNMCR